MNLSDCQVTVMLPVRDVARARDFYETQLALPPGTQKPDGKIVYRCCGTEIALFPKAEGTKAEHTAVSFRVGNIREAVTALKTRSVDFSDYDCLASRRSIMSACWARRKRRGFPIRKAICFVCTRILAGRFCSQDWRA